MLHYVKHETGEPTIWRDPTDIREEMTGVHLRIASAHTCYTALELACKKLMEAPDEQAGGVRALLDTLLAEARNTLDEIDDACASLNTLGKELRETRCLLLKI